MKKMILFVTLIALFSCNTSKRTKSPFAFIENDQGVELCVGGYLTEQDAVQKLQEYASAYSNADEWKERAKAIRENIINGAALDQIPEEEC